MHCIFLFYFVIDVNLFLIVFHLFSDFFHLCLMFLYCFQIHLSSLQVLFYVRLMYQFLIEYLQHHPKKKQKQKKATKQTNKTVCIKILGNVKAYDQNVKPDLHPGFLLCVIIFIFIFFLWATAIVNKHKTL